MNTIQDIVKDGLCTGCGTCFSLCPYKAILLEKDDDKGIYVPIISFNKCKKCGICLNVCPGHEVDFSSLNQEIYGCQPKNNLLGNYETSYVGHSLDEKIRFNSSSGGLVSSVLIYALEMGIIDGALVARMHECNPLEPEIFIAKTKEQILSATGSKYCPVPINSGLIKIMEEDGKFAVVGLPCHIHGIRKAEKQNILLREKIVLHIGIFCANSVNFLGTERFLRDHSIDPHLVRIFSYRGNGWPGRIGVSLQDGSERYIERNSNNNSFFQNLDYKSAFHYDYMPPRCLLCRDLTCELADISFGDAWLPEIIEKDRIGTSLVLARTTKGKNLLRFGCEDDDLALRVIDESDLLRAQNYRFKNGWYSRFVCLKVLGKSLPRYNGIDTYFSIIDMISFCFYIPSYYSSKKIWFRIITKIIAPFRHFLKLSLDGIRIIQIQIRNLL